jgi:hypothetical protein
VTVRFAADAALCVRVDQAGSPPPHPSLMPSMPCAAHAAQLCEVLHMWNADFLRPAVVTLLGPAAARSRYRCVASARLIASVSLPCPRPLDMLLTQNGAVGWGLGWGRS